MFFPGWTDMIATLRASAEAQRGVFDLDLHGGAQLRWPRTTGGDALAIAATVDPHVRDATAYGVVPRLLARWNKLIARMETTALARAAEVYSDNRELWACLEEVAATLDDIGAAVPEDDAWDLLVQKLGGVLGFRNRGPMMPGLMRHMSRWPFKEHTGEVETFHDLYLAQQTHLKGARGFDRREPEQGMSGSAIDVPRTTNADALSLYAYWREQLAAAPVSSGHRTATERLAQLEPAVKRATLAAVPTAVFSDNHALWRALATVARQVSSSEEHGRTNPYLDFLAVPVGLVGKASSAAAGAAKGIYTRIKDWIFGILGKIGLIAGGGAFVVLALFLLLRRGKQ